MAKKRYPQIKNNHAKRYAKLSKADIVEAYRDMFREFGNVGELDDEQWLNDLEHRVELLKHYREFDLRRLAAGNPPVDYVHPPKLIAFDTEDGHTVIVETR